MAKQTTESWRTAKQLPLNMLNAIELAKGAHTDRSNGLCAMEVVAFLAGKPHSDRPECVSPVIGEFVRAWNDALPDADRTRLLRPLLPDLLNTRTTTTDEETRAMLAVDWLVRTFTPVWLDAAKITDEAAALRALPKLRETSDILAAQPIINRARERAAAAGAAAWGAAWDAAGAAAWGAARAAVGAAVGAAAWGAARAAVGAAAWDAVGAAARAAARAAVGAAADKRLAAVVAELQASAVDLLKRMIAVGCAVHP